MLTEKKIGALLVEMPVHEDGCFAGIVSERDIIKCCANYSNFESLPVSEIMQKEMITVGIDDNADDTCVLMREKHIRHIPLVENGKIVALISIRDLMYCVDMEKEITMRHMEDMIGASRRNESY